MTVHSCSPQKPMSARPRLERGAHRCRLPGFGIGPGTRVLSPFEQLESHKPCQLYFSSSLERSGEATSGKARKRKWKNLDAEW